MYTTDSAGDFVIGTQTVMRDGVGVTVSGSVVLLRGGETGLGGLILSAFGRGREGRRRRGGMPGQWPCHYLGNSSAVAFTGQISKDLDT